MKRWKFLWRRPGASCRVTNLSKTAFTSQELFEQIKAQLHFLKRSAEDFDAGHTIEYKRMALALRILCHDTKSSKSLLGLTSRKNRFYLNSSPVVDERNLLDQCNLVSIAMPEDGSPAYWRAELDGVPMEFIGFEEWWQQPVMLDHRYPPFTRKQLVITIANQDGGAHVDAGIEEAFSAVRAAGVQWSNGRQVSFETDRFAIRQIAHEMIKSLDGRYHCFHPLQKAGLAFATIITKNLDWHPRKIVSYHSVNPEALCPCRSFRRFSTCHGPGARRPAEMRDLEHRLTVPPNGKRLSFGFFVGNDQFFGPVNRKTSR